MKRFTCPYCTSSAGYYRVEQARLIRHFSWEGVELHNDIDEDSVPRGSNQFRERCTPGVRQ
jgi:DNA primase catalytic subunit